MAIETVYLETTIVSYLVSLPSRDLIVAAHKQITIDWWATRREEFACYVSQIVIDEASAGDPTEAQKRLNTLSDFPILKTSPDTENLTRAILATGIFPARAIRDAAHIAFTAVHGIDYLMTWNCKHLANAQIIRRVKRICEANGFRLPLICTPEELMG